MFAEQQRLVEGIDQELQLALEIEPSSGFVPDVLARVQRRAFPWRTVMWWGAPAAAAAALILVVLGWPRVTEQQPPDRHDPPVLSTAGTPPAMAPTPPEMQPAPPKVVPSKRPGGQWPQSETRDGVRDAHPVIDQPMHRVEAEVIVPQEPARAVSRYLTLVRRGAIDTSTLSVEGSGDVAPTELAIVPLSVDAVAMPDAENRIGPGGDRRGPGLR